MLFFLTSQQLWISGAIIIGGGTLLAMLGPAWFAVSWRSID
jgi:hypothetical protein